MLSTARVRALRQGRYNVSFEDIRYVAPACLRHRLGLNFEAVSEGKTAEDLIAAMLERVPC
jgi:MoxR-like ATPase